MVRSYDEIYLEQASETIGTMFEYAIELGYNEVDFWNLFVYSDVVKEIERGNPKYVAGLSAIELLENVLKVVGQETNLTIKPFYYPTQYYWAGWALAQYQNYKCIPFCILNKKFPIYKVLSLYQTLHEADITKFFEIADEYCKVVEPETNLKKIRTICGLSQSQLAKKAQVSIRNIQMYEQRNNDINKAQVDILFRLSKILHCNIEDLLEY